jgi:hypothetical protein
MRFAPLQRFPAHSSSIMVGLASPGRLRPQVLSTSRRFFIRREPAGLVSCRIRSWGCALQSFSPTAWPYAVSSADPLVVLVPLVSISTSRSRSRPRRPRPPRTRTTAASSHRGRSPGGPKPLPPISPTPKRRRAERSPDPREPKPLRAGQWLYSPGPKPHRAERPSESDCAEAPPNRPSARSAGAEAPPDETYCPLPAAPKSCAVRTSARSSHTRRHPTTGPLARLSGTRESQPVRAIPLAPRRSRSPAGNPEAAAQRSRNRSSVHTRRAVRSSRARRLFRLGRPRLSRRDPKAVPLPACSPPHSTGNRSHGEARRPSRTLRSPKTSPSSIGLPVSRRSEDPVELRRGPKTSLETAGVRRPRRRGQVVRSRQNPKALPVPDTS